MADYQHYSREEASQEREVEIDTCGPIQLFSELQIGEHALEVRKCL